METTFDGKRFDGDPGIVIASGFGTVRGRVNGFGRYGNDGWLPMWISGGQSLGTTAFHDPAGLKIMPPDEWREATPEQISAELENRGERVIWGAR